MAVGTDDLKLRLQYGRESLDTELKPWNDPTTDFGKAIIAKACMALRNGNGGFLIIGMCDDGTPDNRSQNADVRSRFHHDCVQEIVSKYSSEPFEITVHFIEHGGAERVMIEVPSGVRTPVICRNDLPKHRTLQGHEAGSLIAANSVYVRTLSSNGRPSTAPAQLVDWPRIMETCFNNREADIGAFMRRQLSGLDITSTTSALFEILQSAKRPSPQQVADELLERCYSKYLNYRKKHQTPTVGVREVAGIISGEFDHPELDQDYMRRLGQISRYSGWPPFVSLMNLDAGIGQPVYINEGWESLEYVTQVFHSLEFSRIEPSGKFYSLEALRDDMLPNVAPLRQLSLEMETARVTEVIATVLLFAKTFCGQGSTNDVSITFRWKGLAGRRLVSNRGYIVRQAMIAAQDEIITHATIPVAVPIDAIGLHIESIVKPLFRLFGGWPFGSGVLQDIVTGRLSGRT